MRLLLSGGNASLSAVFALFKGAALWTHFDHMVFAFARFDTTPSLGLWVATERWCLESGEVRQRSLGDKLESFLGGGPRAVAYRL
jgi:hypothetical protein